MISNVSLEKHVLLTMSFHDICDTEGGSLDVKNFDHLLVNLSHRRRVAIQQAADGAHGDGPPLLSAACKDAATSKDFFSLERHVEEGLVLISLLVVRQGQLLDFSADSENPRYFLHTLETYRYLKKKRIINMHEKTEGCFCKQRVETWRKDVTLY